jgi:hypothetical protein
MIFLDMETSCRLAKLLFNSSLAIGGVPSPFDSFEVVESSVLKSPPITNLQNVRGNCSTRKRFESERNQNDKKYTFEIRKNEKIFFLKIKQEIVNLILFLSS